MLVDEFGKPAFVKIDAEGFEPQILAGYTKPSADVISLEFTPSHMFKTIAHTPGLAVGIAGFLKVLLGDGALPGWYKELVAARVAYLVECDY